MADAHSTSAHTIRSREEAKSLGLRSYFTGVPCTRGHICERAVSNTGCRECTRAIDRARKNGQNGDPDHFRRAEIKRASQQARCLAIADGSSTFINASPCSACGTYVKYSGSRHCVECSRLGSLKHKMDPRNQEYYRKASEKWRTENTERRRSISQNYKHKRRAQEASGMSYSELHTWKKRQKKVCYWCGKKCATSFCVDHYIPLAKGGKHDVSNLVIACRSCNGRKSDKDPEVFRSQLWVGTLFAGASP